MKVAINEIRLNFHTQNASLKVAIDKIRLNFHIKNPKYSYTPTNNTTNCNHDSAGLHMKSQPKVC